MTIESLYKCTSVGPVNNGLKINCEFKARFESSMDYHCPLCGQKLQIVSDGPSVREVLRMGEARHRDKQK